MLKKRKSLTIILLVLFLSVFSLNIFIQIYDKNNISYFVEAEDYQSEYLNANSSISGSITLISSNPYKISIYVDAKNWDSGTLEFKLYKDSQTIIYSALLYPENCIDDLLLIEIPSSVFLEKGSYSVSFTGNNIASEIIFFKDSVGAFKEIQYYNVTKALFYVAVLILDFLFVIIVLAFLSIKKIEKAFLFLAIFIGIIFVFIIPPYTAPDELRHFARSYDIASGNFVCKDYETKKEFDNQTMPICEFPKELFELKLISQDNGINYTRETNTKINLLAFKDKINRNFSGETVRIPIHGDHTTSCIAFLPQVISILAAKFLNVSPIIMFYMTRIWNLAAAIFIAYLGLKKIPQYKILYMILYFAPGMIFLRSTSSTDGFLYSLILLFIAQIIYLIFTKASFWRNGCVVLSVIAVCITLIKMPYFIIFMLIVLLDQRQFTIAGKEYKCTKYLYLAGLLTSCFTICSISHKILDYNAEVISTLYASSAELDVSYISYALNHIFRIINMFFQTGVVNLYDYFFEAISFPNAGYLVIPYLMICLMVVFYGEYNFCMRKRDRIIFLLIGIGMWFIVCAAFYFIGPGPDIGYIWGLQGRYLYPALPLIFIALTSKNKNQSFCPPLLESTAILIGIYALSLSEYWI